MRLPILLSLLALSLPAVAGPVFTPLFQVDPNSGKAFELGWNSDGVAMRAGGKVSTLVALNCHKDLDPEMTVTEEKTYKGGKQYQCSYSATFKDSPMPSSLQRDCKLVYNGRFFEAICREDYAGGAHPDGGYVYHYLTGDGKAISATTLGQLLDATEPLSADLKKRAAAMSAECGAWFKEQGEAMSPADLQSMIGEPSRQRLGVDADGNALIGMSYYLVRVGRSNPCDQKTFWVRAANSEAWKKLDASGKVKAVAPAR